jgi:hypothetical protein
MRKMSFWRAWLLTALTALAPGLAAAQDYAPPDLGGGLRGGLPVPLYSTRPEDGGLFTAASYVMYRQTNPIKDQEIARRGFIAVDDTVLGPGTAGTFIGSGREALNAQQVSGPNSYQPGFNAEIGWRFHDGSTLSVGWMYLTSTQYRAVATLAAPGLRVRSDFADSFLTAPVFNFPSEFAGPPDKIGAGGPEAAFGIWNAASVMTLDYRQRVQQWEATYRVPIFETEDYRLSGLFGPRFFWIWERFKWRTTDLDASGNTLEQFVGVYNQIDSNRMYGLHVGCSNECYWGHGIATQCDLQGALFVDSVKELQKYETGVHDNLPQNKRSRRDWAYVPELQGTIWVVWYPTEGIQFRVGYDAMLFFNTLSAPRPVDFNYSSLDPHYEHTFRIFDGFQVGVALIF